MSEYVIPFTGLSIGKHTYDFDIDKKFFDVYGNELVQTGQISVVMDLIKSANMLVLEFTHKGNIDAECDRCLNDIQLLVEGFNRVVIKFGDATGEESDDILVLPREAYEIDVAPIIYEFIGTSVPYRKVPDDCDELDRYCDPEIGNRVNGIIIVSEEDDSIEIKEPAPDPRWEKLKNLIDNKSKNKE